MCAYICAVYTLKPTGPAIRRAYTHMCLVCMNECLQPNTRIHVTQRFPFLSQPTVLHTAHYLWGQPPQIVGCGAAPTGTRAAHSPQPTICGGSNTARAALVPDNPSPAGQSPATRKRRRRQRRRSHWLTSAVSCRDSEAACKTSSAAYFLTPANTKIKSSTVKTVVIGGFV